MVNTSVLAAFLCFLDQVQCKPEGCDTHRNGKGNNACKGKKLILGHLVPDMQRQKKKQPAAESQKSMFVILGTTLLPLRFAESS